MEEELDCVRLCKVRLDHLKSFASGEQTEGMKKAWKKIRVDRMLVDHFLRAGYYTSAVRLAESSGIEVCECGCMCMHACILVCASPVVP